MYRYHEQLFELLYSQQSKGMKLEHIVRHIYNENNTFFSEAEAYDQLYFSLQAYLVRQCRIRKGAFSQVEGKVGWYRIRRSIGLQTRLKFTI